MKIVLKTLPLPHNSKETPTLHLRGFEEVLDTYEIETENKHYILFIIQQNA